MRRITDIPTHFWGKVDIKRSDECWPWKAGRFQFGHGCYKFNQKDIPASRMAYILVKGELQEGQIVCHQCDNPPCCNPNHLFAGTKRDNALDRNKKGRQASGEKCGNSKLTLIEVKQIRNMYATGKYTMEEIGLIFNCGERNVGHIIRFQTWKEVD